MSKLFSTLLIVSLLLIGSTTAVFANHVEATRIAFPVTLADGQTYTLVGYLYDQHGNPNNVGNCGERSHTIQVLLHGGTYNHKYWDAGLINNTNYSYASYMAGQCYTVLALDRLGTGESSKPDGDFINKVNEADAIAQILTSLRINHNPTQRKFKRIVLVGHSFGSFLSVFTLGEYGNVADGLVVTGWLQAPGTVPLDPALVGQLLQTPYIAATPEIRQALFFYPDTTDPAVAAYDNANLADAMTRGFFLDAISVFAARDPQAGDIAQVKALTKVDQVNVPVFIQLGDHDVLFPAAFGGNEASYYSSSPSVTLETLPNIGHGFNVHTNHLEGWQQIDSWIANHIQ